MRLRAGVVSDCGLIRAANEDSFLLRPGLYAVCDGMGGARAGEVASQMACLGLVGVNPESAGEDELRHAVAGANKAIVQRSATEGELLGMGTTLTAALVKDSTLILAHVGDSRAYLFREGELTQLTSDHSWVGEMIRRGEITAEEAATHPHRSVITRALGTDLEVDPEVVEVQLSPGDRVIVCSDGLTSMVDDKGIAQVLKRDREPQAAAQALVDAALANGGEDNVTVVVVDVTAEGAKDGQSSWEDMRVLIGPSDRIAPPLVSVRRQKRALQLARERLARRGPAVARPGARVAEGVSLSEATGAGSAGDAKEAGESPGQVVPPPTGKGQKKARAGGSGTPWWRRRWFFIVVAVLLALAIAVGAFAWYGSTVYYVGTDEGKVALFRGLPGDVLGIELSSVFERSTVDYDSLSPYMRAQVDAHDLVDQEEGEQFLHALSAGQ